MMQVDVQQFLEASVGMLDAWASALFYKDGCTQDEVRELLSAVLIPALARHFHECCAVDRPLVDEDGLLSLSYSAEELAIFYQVNQEVQARRFRERSGVVPSKKLLDGQRLDESQRRRQEQRILKRKQRFD